VLKYDVDRDDDFHAGFTRRFNERQGGDLPAHRRPPTNEIDALATKIQEEADFLAEHSDAAKAVADFCKHWDREIKVASGNVVDLKMILCIGLVGFMIFEVGAAHRDWSTKAANSDILYGTPTGPHFIIRVGLSHVL
jgi:hypothetical protein